MGRLDLVVTCREFVRSPTGQRIIREVVRGIADPRNRRRVVALVHRLRTDPARIVVVDADPAP